MPHRGVEEELALLEQVLAAFKRGESRALPTEDSARIALRTQQIIAAESGVVNTVDPIAGSYAVESLTNTIEREAQEILARIERTGGTLAAIESGLIEREIQESAFQAQQAIDAGRSVVVGVNKFTEKATGVISTSATGARTGSRPLFQIDPDVEPRQIARLHALRAARDAAACREALAAVSRAASDGSNLVPPIVAAVEARATVGEIADTMRTAFGEFEERR